MILLYFFVLLVIDFLKIATQHRTTSHRAGAPVIESVLFGVISGLATPSELHILILLPNPIIIRFEYSNAILSLLAPSEQYTIYLKPFRQREKTRLCGLLGLSYLIGLTY